MVANIRYKSHDYYSERNWHPPAACVEQAIRQVQSRSRERGRVKLAWTASISLCRAIRNIQYRGLQQKISTPATTWLCFTRVKHLRIDLALISLKGFRSIENQNFPTKTNRNSQDLIYEMQNNKRERLDLHTLVYRTAETFRWTWLA
jgi:hypothetical protein